ncbi:MAG: NADH-quinone oxidoreductase subunit L [Proteobacteria bacterium]|nr:NADH-quinone oxidoreductase subunit L [Pseudomonadota bacterium]MCL2307683.1 NADH-quinone oxidoreductase subunit L [Pseudomonadota bacterium]
MLALIPLLPLFAALFAGFFGRRVPRGWSHWVCCAAVGISFVLSAYALYKVVFLWPALGIQAEVVTLYTWLDLGSTKLTIGFLIDPLSALMMVVVTLVSFLVHVYTIGYMKDDPGYARFFSYIAFFTFSMLMLVMSDNFLQMFFGWEGVGLASYLLIGFWYTRPSATKAGMKAFLMNRVGDFGFIVGIGLLFAALGTLNFGEIFARVDELKGLEVSLWPGLEWSLLTVACIGLFVGAMGKSAQVPLHTWLPDSMEGPTPISALIHAATMVTAGIFMVARMSPVFEGSDAALSFMIIIGATTAISMALLGLVQNDIKRVVAYSTLSQLGYMTVALGASAYSAAIFHLMTHAFFKALLFLAAGSVIIALHHEQDLRKMGGLRHRMPITYWTALIGAWALVGLPPFSGFFSKEPIIEAARFAEVAGHTYAYWALTLGVFLTACYTFRMIFLAFHGEPRYGETSHGSHKSHKAHKAAHKEHHEQPKESPWVVTVPLIVLAVCSVFAGILFVQPVLFGDYFGAAIRGDYVAHPAMAVLHAEWRGIISYLLHAFLTPPLWLALAGIATAWYFTLVAPKAAGRLTHGLGAVFGVFKNHFYIDAFYERVMVRGTHSAASWFVRGGERFWSEGVLVQGTARLVHWGAQSLRYLQTGYLYHYAFAMVLGLLVLITLWGRN